MSLVIRPLQPNERNFVRDSWRSCLWKNEVDRNAVTFETFFNGMEDYWTAIEMWRDTVYTVAEFKDVPGEIIGYAVHVGPDDCLWVYVKSPYRRQGVGTALLRGATRLGTITQRGKKFAESRGLTLDPWMHYRRKSQR